MCLSHEPSIFTTPPPPSYPTITSRSFRKVLKPRLPRKVTASARINLNRFWNELEEFYDRYDRRRLNTCGLKSANLPAYTTDTLDHNREEAENELNERLERLNNQAPRPRLMSEDVNVTSTDEDTSDEEEVHSPVAVWNCIGERSPPRALLNICHKSMRS